MKNCIFSKNHCVAVHRLRTVGVSLLAVCILLAQFIFIEPVKAESEEAVIETWLESEGGRVLAPGGLLCYSKLVCTTMF